MRADIKLLAVTPSMPPVYVGEGFIPTDTLDAEKERFREVLDDGIRQLEAQGFACQGQLSYGEPVDEIARVAREWGADLIVMGHRRATSWTERWWRGSLSKSLVEIAPCSVLIAVITAPPPA
jgi:nucleotide-binding universal stress UspA family protein